MEWVATIIFGTLGIFLLVITYGALIKSYRTGDHISGVPVLGGLFIFLAFILSPIKWLALLVLLDYGVWMLPYVFISDYINNKKFKSIYEAEDYCDTMINNTQKMVISIPERNEKLERPYITNAVDVLRYPKLLFSVCLNKKGERFILIDRYSKGRKIEILPFDNGEIAL